MTGKLSGTLARANIQNTSTEEVLAVFNRPVGGKSIPTPYIYDIGSAELDVIERHFVENNVGYGLDSNKGVMPSGATLFSRIVADPDYYVDRAEKTLIEGNIINFPPDAVVTELGPGDGHKTALIFDQQTVSENVLLQLIDVSADFLEATVGHVAHKRSLKRCPRTCEGDFFKAVHGFEKADMVLFLGTTISNFEPDVAQKLLAKIANDYLRPEGVLVLGQDGNQNVETLQHCYDDRRKHTAAFVMNGLRQIKRDIIPTLRLDDFSYCAYFDDATKVMRMGIKCLKDETYAVGEGTIKFGAGEFIQVGQSRKYPAETVVAMARMAGFTPIKTLSSPENVNIHFLKNG